MRRSRRGRPAADRPADISGSSLLGRWRRRARGSPWPPGRVIAGTGNERPAVGRRPADDLHTGDAYTIDRGRDLVKFQWWNDADGHWLCDLNLPEAALEDERVDAALREFQRALLRYRAMKDGRPAVTLVR